MTTRYVPRLYGGGHIAIKGRRPATLNDTDRAQWIDNDEGLYNWWRSSGQSKREFIRQNRRAIGAAIGTVTSGKQPAHFLAYRPNRKGD